jgi:multisubunit Na+/H+ antiporter MnhB subunit
MRNEKYRMLMILIVVGIIVTAIGVIFLYFVGIDPINQNSETAIRGLNIIINKLNYTIVPTPIPTLPMG